MHVNAVQKVAHSYEHIRPGEVGNAQVILVSELSGQSNILMKAEEIGLPLEKGSPQAKAVLTKVKEQEKEGYSYEAAGGSLELLIRKEIGRHEKRWALREYQCNFRQYRDGHNPVCEATVKMEVDGVGEYTASEGHGVVNALDKALRQALMPHFPAIEGVSLIDYKVRIVDGHAATAAMTSTAATAAPRPKWTVCKHVNWFHGQPLPRSHFTSSRLPPPAACAITLSSIAKPPSPHSHFTNSRCPYRAAT